MTIPPPSRPVQLLLRVVYPPLAVLVTLAAIPLVLLGLLLWPLDRRVRLARVVLLAVYFMWEDVGVLAQCWLLWLRSPRRTSRTWTQDHEQLVVDALDNVLRTAKRLIGFEVVVDELDLGDDRTPVIVLARHAGPADSIALAWLLASRGGRVPRIVLAAGLQWDPGLGMVLNRLDSYFVPSASGAGDDRVRGVAELAESLEPRDALLIFPEGRNWTPHRQAQVISSLRAKGDDAAADRAARRPWVLPPRSRGVQAIVAAQPDAPVVVAAHTGLELLASPRAIWREIPFGPEQGLRVRGRTYPGTEVPDDADGVVRWLDERWGEIDAWVAEHHPA